MVDLVKVTLVRPRRPHKDRPHAACAAVALALLLSGTASRADAADGPAGRQARRLAGRTAGKPAYLWLWYADGSALPEDGPYCTGLRPPAFKCNYGPTIEDCQRQVQAVLDTWYADFNVVFTLSRPPSGDYYAMMITSEGSWCQQSATEAGVAPFNCNDNPGQSAFAFECGYSAHACATLIAHEHGHMVGLEHTTSTTDVMNPTVLGSSAGFDDKSGTTVEGFCGGTQNSYQQMLAAMGRWPGGAKPTALSGLPDAGLPDAQLVGSVDAAPPVGSVGTVPAGSGTDAAIGVLPGFDALTRPALGASDGPVSKPPSQHSGCSLIPGATTRSTPRAAAPTVAVAFWAALIALALVLGPVRRSGLLGLRIRPRDRAARRAQPRDFLS
jgi:hypothetical protein